MKKKMIGILIAMLMVSMIPIAAGTNDTTNQPKTTGADDLGRTFIWGIIAFRHLDKNGNSITFRAIYVHYKYTSILGTEKGVLHGFQKITVPTDIFGGVRPHFVFAVVNGNIGI